VRLGAVETGANGYLSKQQLGSCRKWFCGYSRVDLKGVGPLYSEAPPPPCQTALVALVVVRVELGALTYGPLGCWCAPWQRAWRSWPTACSTVTGTSKDCARGHTKAAGCGF